MRIGAVFNSDLTDVHHRVVVPLRELSRRGHEVVYVQPDVSGHVAPGDPRSLVDWSALARLRGTLVLLMAVERLGAIAETLIAGGRDPRTPVAVVQEGVTPKTIATKLYNTPVDLGDRTNVPFSFVIEDFSYPAPSPAVAESYVFYLGFDPNGAKPERPAKKGRKG